MVKFETLYNAHALAALLHGVSLAVMAILSPSQSVPVEADVPGPSTAPFSIVTRHESLKTVPLIWWIEIFLWGAFAEHVAVVFMPGLYREILRTRVNPWRWTEYFVSATFKNVALAQLCRVTNVHLIYMLAIVTAFTMAHGYMSEMVAAYEDDQGSKRRTKALVIFEFGSGLYLFGFWSVVICFYSISVRQSIDPVPGFVHAIFATQLVLDSGFAVNTWLYLNRYIRDFSRYELYFVLLSLLSKTSLAWILYGGGTSVPS